MENELKNTVNALVDDYSAQVNESSKHTSVIVSAEKIIDALRFLKDEHAFELLSDLTAVDYWPEKKPRFHVIYQLNSYSRNLRMEVRVHLTGNAPSLESAVAVYPVANWSEREIWDMFGITFIGHPDLRRILMPYDWVGHPLRKDYPLGYEEVQFSFNYQEIAQKKPRPKE
jgi:NADH-quinone oxidoreductase subunit C